MKMTKTHSQKHADEFIRLGWTLKYEFRVEGDTEPYEYILEWKHEGLPKLPSPNAADWGKA